MLRRLSYALLFFFFGALGCQPDVTALIAAGTVALKANNSADAVQLFEQAERFDPSHPRVQWSLGIVHARLGNGDIAVSHYKKYLALAPDAPDVSSVKRIIADYEAE